MPPSDAKKPFQFTLRGMMKLTLFLRVALTVVRILNTPWEESRGEWRQRKCGINLKMIGVALQHYHQVFGCFPPSMVRDEDGEPMHSWRTLIRPYLEEPEGFVRSYDFSQPWEAAANLAIARSWPSMEPFGCPEQYPYASGMTNYVMILGPDAARRGGVGSMTNDARPTILVAEIANSNIFWTEPRDLELSAMSLKINDKSKPSISSCHRHGAMVLFADGTIKFLHGSTTPEQLRSMLTTASND